MLFGAGKETVEGYGGGAGKAIAGGWLCCPKCDGGPG